MKKVEPDQFSANRALALENDFEDLLVDREIKIVDDMVLKYRSSKITPEYLHGQVAVLAELRRIRDQLKTNALKEIQLLEESHDH